MRSNHEEGQFVNTQLKGRTTFDYEERTGAGAASLECELSYWTSSGAGQVVTLADGREGQQKTILHAVDGTGSLVVTPANFGGTASTTVTLVDAGDSVTFRFVKGNWWLVAAVANTEGTPLVIA